MNDKPYRINSGRGVQRQKQNKNRNRNKNRSTVPYSQQRRARGSKKMRWDALLERIPKDRVFSGIEVGVWDGQNCGHLLAARPLLHLVLVDRWEPPKPEDSYASSGAKIAAQPQSRHTEAYNRTMAAIKDHIDRVVILKGDSVPMAENIEDHSVDFVFIDGDHSEEGVSKDVVAYLPKIKKGGFISGHDWNGKWGTEKGVLRHFKREQVKLDGNSTWFISL